MLDKFEDYNLTYEIKGVRIPLIDLKGFEDEHEYLRHLCLKGYKEKGIDKLPNKDEYIGRVKYELETLKKLGFTRYILMIWDLIRWCDEQNIPRGFGRGSVAGSLIAYLIDMTATDPVKYGLIFERFINESRAKSKIIDGEQYSDGGSVPDIDVDVSYVHRERIIKEYLERKYPNRTAFISTLNTLSTKLVLKEVAKKYSLKTETEANKISSWVDSNAGVLETIDECLEHNIQFRDWANNHKDEIKIAKKLLGLPKNFGVHAAGIIVSYGEIQDSLPLEIKAESSVERLCCPYTKDDVAEIEIKADVLGLKTVDLIYNTAKEAGFNLNKFDVDDESIYHLLELFENSYGVFQLDGETASRVTKKVKPRNLEDVSSISAIARPGAFAFLDDFIKARETGKIKSIYPPIDEILKKTSGTILYQESIMSIASQVYGFSLVEADVLRKCITGDSYFVSKTRGYISINTLLKEGYKDDLFLVLNKKGEKFWKPIKEIWCNGIKRTKKVQSQNGLFVQSTGLHQFMTVEGFKARNRLNTGDFLVCARSIDFKGFDYIDEETALMITGIVCEGYTPSNKERGTFVNHDEWTMKLFQDWYRKVYGSEPNTSKDGNVLYFNRKELLRLKNIGGMESHLSENKALPEKMLGMSGDVTKKILSFIFNCEGHFCHENQAEIGISSKSIKLIQQIGLLLLRFGIHMNYYTKTVEGYGEFQVLSTRDSQNIIKFRNNLKECLQPRKAEALEILYKEAISKKMSNTKDLIPHYLVKKMIDQYPKCISGEGTVSIYKKDISRHKFKRLAEKTKDGYWNQIANGEQFYSKVKECNGKSIGEVKVYDFTIDEETPYAVCNGMVIHNCIGKKKIEEVEEWKEKIEQAGAKRGIPESATKIFWETVRASAKYSFNKSHSISYAYISILCAFLKVKYPAIFFKNCLMLARTFQNSEQRIMQICKELPNFGVSIKPPDLIKSEEDFTVQGNLIRYGLQSIKSVSYKTLEKIKKFNFEQPNKFKLFESAKESGITIAILKNLIRAGCLNSFDENRGKLVLEACTWNLLTEAQKIKISKFGAKYKHNILDILVDIKNGKLLDDGKEIISTKKRANGKSTWDNFYNKYLPFKEEYTSYKTESRFFDYYFEQDVLGFAYSNTLQSIIKPKYDAAIQISDIENVEEDKVVIFGGIVQEAKLGKTKRGGKMLTMTIADETGETLVRVFNYKTFDRDSYQKLDINNVDDIQEEYGRLPEKKDIVVIRGTKKDFAVFGEKIKILNEEYKYDR